MSARIPDPSARLLHRVVQSPLAHHARVGQVQALEAVVLQLGGDVNNCRSENNAIVLRVEVVRPQGPQVPLREERSLGLALLHYWK